MFSLSMMDKSRRTDLERVLNEQLRRVQAEIDKKLVGFRDGDAHIDVEPNGISQTSAADDAIPVLDMMIRRRDQIRRALASLDSGTFGVCHSCGHRIPSKRLESLPFALRCRQCEELREATVSRRQANIRSYFADLDS
jgi:DnaK suppressor protein